MNTILSICARPPRAPPLRPPPRARACVRALQVAGKCCIATYLGGQPRHLTRYSTLPCNSGGKNGEARVKRQYFSTSGARFCGARAPPPRCYLADALLFDALNRKDVLSGGGQLHSRPNPITGAVGGGGRGGGGKASLTGRTLATRRRCVFPLGACCARLVVFQLYPNPSVFPPPPSLSPSRSLSPQF